MWIFDETTIGQALFDDRLSLVETDFRHVDVIDQRETGVKVERSTMGAGRK